MSRVPTQLAVLAPVMTGREDALRAAIAALPEGDGSPFASLPGTHFGRWLVLSRPGPDAVLVFSVVTDLAPADCLRTALDRMEAARGLWAHCRDWPGTDDRAVALEYLERHVVPASLPFATWDAPVERILKGLDIQRRLRSFVLRTGGADPTSLQRAFVEEFGA